MSRRYYQPLKECATEIVSDIIRVPTRHGSSGWSGSLEDVEGLKQILAPFNIRYTDDLLGSWGLVESSK